MKQPFFLKTWFIGILYAFWFIYGIPLAGSLFFYPKMIPYYDKRLIYAIYSRWAAYVSSFICDIRCPFFAPCFSVYV